MAEVKRVELLTFGEELLLGLRVNGHLVYLGEELSRRGLPVARCDVLSDTPAEIESGLSEAWKRADIIITTGGLGPTSDDNSREAVARAIGLELEFDPWAQEALESRFQRLGREPGPQDIKQCYKPRGAEILVNRLGTAPGIYLQHEGKHLVMLPGPAHELGPMFENEVLPRLDKEGLLNEQEAFLQLRTFGIPEGRIESHLEPVIGSIEGLGLAFCTHKGIVDVRLSPGEARLPWSRLEEIAHSCREALGDDFICFGEDSMARVVVDQLRALEKCMATAESVTGGLLSSTFTNVNGASKVFRGGAVCYTNDTKIELLDVPEPILDQHGAVSEETAAAMATGAAERFSTDYALSLTGYAGPEGGTPENPVGTIYIGYHSPVGVWAHKLVFPGDRKAIKARAVNAALDIMRRNLNRYKLAEFIISETQASGTG